MTLGQHLVEQGKIEGRVEGRLEERRKIVKRFMEKAYDLSLISEITEMTEVEIRQILN